MPIRGTRVPCIPVSVPRPQLSQPWPQQQEEPRGFTLGDGNLPCDARADVPGGHTDPTALSSEHWV